MSIWLRRATLLGLIGLALAGLRALVTDPASPRIRAAEPNAAAGAKRAELDPSAWGSDHTEELLPEYVDSGECLFCHRNDIGESWSKNKHAQTVHDIPAESPAMAALMAAPGGKEVAAQVELLMGDTRAQRFLKRSAAFGQFELLSATAVHGRGRRFVIEPRDPPHWDAEIFSKRCAGCHTTGIDPDTHAFMTASLDCYVCHGDGPLEHANDPKLMPLAEARKDSPEVVTSICAQCHIRSGKSKSSGLPYPNNFVAGDNLFKDFHVDWSLADDPQLNPADRHVLDNVREVVLYGNKEMTCLSCHEVHAGNAVKHRSVPDQAYCQHCHEPGKDKKLHKIYEVHSELCGY